MNADRVDLFLAILIKTAHKDRMRLEKTESGFEMALMRVLGLEMRKACSYHTATHDGDHSVITPLSLAGKSVASRQRLSHEGMSRMLQGQAPSGPLMGRPTMRLRLLSCRRDGVCVTHIIGLACAGATRQRVGLTSSD
jgi:hypothetical protein